MRKRTVTRTTGRTRVLNGNAAVTTPAVIRQRKQLLAISTKLRQAERLFHTINQIAAKLA